MNVFKKHGAKLASVILALVMVLGLSVDAFAEETVEVPEEEQIVEETTPTEGEEAIPEETPEAGDEGTGEETPEEVPEDVTPDGEIDKAATDVFTRVYEFVAAYSAEIASYVATAVMIVYAFYQKNKNGVFFSGIRKLLETQGDTRDVTNEVFSRQKDLTEKLDAALEQMTVLTDEIKADKKEIAELKKTLAANAVETMSVLEILHIAYINNPQIPDSMKNLITAKYAGVLGKINDDEGLKRAFKEMRKILGIEGGEDDEGEAN